MTPTFEQRYTEICVWVDKRRRKWDLNVVDWDDARQMILIHISEQYDSYDPTLGPFGNWVNRLITNKIKNIWRDHYTNYSRPCILGCPYNSGGQTCSKTRSGTQGAECPAYRDWQKRKGDQFNVRQTLSLDNHAQEVSNVSSDFMDIAAKKRVIDARIREKLTKQEWRIYKTLIIQGKSEEETAKALGFKNKRGQKMFGGYLVILAARHRFVEMAKAIIEDEDLA